MLKINFSSAIAAYLCLSIFLVFIMWIFYNYHRDGILNETKYLQQCPFCTYLFFDYRQGKPSPHWTRKTQEDSIDSRQKSDVLKCPRCQSYIQVEEAEENTG